MEASAGTVCRGVGIGVVMEMGYDGVGVLFKLRLRAGVESGD